MQLTAEKAAGDIRSLANPRHEGSALAHLGRQTVVVVTSTALIAVCAHISFALPFTPVPTTLGTFAVLLVGLVLGPARGLATLLLYLAEGALGLPVFSPQGLGGVFQILGPTGGFLVSYPLAAVLAGALVGLFRRRISPVPAAISAAILASVPVFLLGALWLAHLLRLSPAVAVSLAVTPFLAGEAVKVLAAALLYAALERHARA